MTQWEPSGLAKCTDFLACLSPAGAAQAVCGVCLRESLFSPCTPMTLCHWAPLHPSEAAGGGGGSAPACAATRWPCLQAIPEQEGLHARGFQIRLFISIPGVTTLHSGEKHPGWIWADVFGAETVSGSVRADQGGAAGLQWGQYCCAVPWLSVYTGLFIQGFLEIS